MSVGRLLRRLLRHRRGFLGLSLAGLTFTLAATVLASNPETVGPSMLLPWVALFAFEVGPAVGLAGSVIALALYTVSADGLNVTPAFVTGRLAAFALIGIGLGFAGRRLRESERTSRRLVEGLPLVMYIESEGRLTYISPQIEGLLGYPLEAWNSVPNLWRRALHPQDRERVVASYSEAVATGAEFECDYRMVGPDKRTIWVRDSSTCIDDGKRAHRQGFIVDVTLQKESAAAAERNATLMRSLMDGTVDGITLTDRDGRIAIANRPMGQYARELRIPNEGLMHERLLAIADRVVDRDRYAARMRELAASPDTESFDEFELHETGRVFQGFTKAVLGSDDEYLGRVWTLREVTQARQADRIKDALVATVSHELRTPLTSIIGYLELLGTSSTPLGDEDARYADVVRRNAVRLQHMVEDLLFLARVDGGGLSLELDRADVTELASSAVASARPLAAAKEVGLEFEGRRSPRVLVDANRISQVFDNLVSNAIKFTPPGGSVKVTVSSDDAATVVSVADTGCGIPTTEQSRLFERFFRSSATAHLPGTGLGLAIAHAIVASHGGSITCRSEEGEGTTFTLSIPMQPPATRHGGRNASHPQAAEMREELQAVKR
jgi:two-component system phosphate regulon sensor histidine kinase PhoR